MSWMTKAFFRGLAAVVPFALTIYVVYWLVTSAENLLAVVYKKVFPETSYYYGLGLAFAIVLVFTVGVLVNAIVLRQFYRAGVRLLQRTPVIKSLYGMLRDMMGFFTLSDDPKFSQVVLAEVGGAKLVGFVTRDDFIGLPDGLGDADTVGVYLPMSYQLGGYLAMLPRAAVRPLNMSIEEALRFTVTGGVTTREED
jgi:uncharacterized membrane protein